MFPQARETTAKINKMGLNQGKNLLHAEKKNISKTSPFQGNIPARPTWCSRFFTLKDMFDCPFKSECAKAGEKVRFTIPEAIYTKEGTLLIPACSKVIATVIKINHQYI